MKITEMKAGFSTFRFQVIADDGAGTITDLGVNRLEAHWFGGRKYLKLTSQQYVGTNAEGDRTAPPEVKEKAIREILEGCQKIRVYTYAGWTGQHPRLVIRKFTYWTKCLGFDEPEQIHLFPLDLLDTANDQHTTESWVIPYAQVEVAEKWLDNDAMYRAQVPEGADEIRRKIEAGKFGKMDDSPWLEVLIRSTQLYKSNSGVASITTHPGKRLWNRASSSGTPPSASWFIGS